MTEIDYAARVAKGVALLDEKWPEWATEINLDTLDVQSSNRCVTAQYSFIACEGEAEWTDGMYALGLTSGNVGTYVAHGFNAEVYEIGDDAPEGYDQQGVYGALNALWKGVIAERRAAANTDTPEGTS